MLLLITTDKVFTAFLGALIALGLKVIYDVVIDYNKKVDIRRMAYLDIQEQKGRFFMLIDDCKNIIKIIEDDSSADRIRKSSIIDATIFKSHTVKDYFKAFDEEYFLSLMRIYSTIEKYSKTIVYDEYLEYWEEIDKCENPNEYDRIQERYKRHFEVHIQKCSQMIEVLDKFIETYKREYNTSY